MGTVSLDLPIIGNNNSTEDPKIRSNFSALQTAVNGNLNADNLLASDADKLGLNYTGVVHRGKSIIATEESRTNVAFGLMTTPDRVLSVALPTDGLISIAYMAMFKSSGTGTGIAELFLGANAIAVYIGSSSALSVGQVNTSSSFADRYEALSTYSGGLCVSGQSAADKAVPSTTGQYVTATAGLPTVEMGGIAYIFAAAGIYDVSVQFKATSGSVTVKNRKLWVWTTGF